MRRRFIDHVHKYNMKQEPRRRFYLLGLVKEDHEFLEQVRREGLMGGMVRESGGKLVWASDCCFESIENGQAGEAVCKTVEECLETSQRSKQSQNGVEHKRSSWMTKEGGKDH